MAVPTARPEGAENWDSRLPGREHRAHFARGCVRQQSRDCLVSKRYSCCYICERNRVQDTYLRFAIIGTTECTSEAIMPWCQDMGEAWPIGSGLRICVRTNASKYMRRRTYIGNVSCGALFIPAQDLVSLKSWRCVTLCERLCATAISRLSGVQALLVLLDLCERKRGQDTYLGFGIIGAAECISEVVIPVPWCQDMYKVWLIGPGLCASMKTNVSK